MVGLVALLAAPALADWYEGDGHKQHWPQLPDPNGWDIDITYPNVVADDWRCSQTGPVTDFHVWISIENDWMDQIPDPPNPSLGDLTLVSIEWSRVRIFKDIPVGAQGNEYSMPQEIPVWERVFAPDELILNPNPGFGVQGWANPSEPSWIPDNHDLYYQINIVDFDDPFIQHEGEIYWLELTVKMIDNPLGSRVGWKTTRPFKEPLAGWNDDAVYGIEDPGAPTNWNELWLNNQPFGVSLDMAFVTTPEPTGLALAALGLIGLAAVARRRRT